MFKIMISVLIATIIGLSVGCTTNSPSSPSSLNETIENGKTDIVEQNSNSVIIDIDNWNHPTKDIFKKRNIEVTKVELLNNNTLPIFYITSNSQVWEDAIYDYNFQNEVAEKNGYWNYQIVSDKGKSVTVDCDRKEGIITKSVSDKGTIDYTKYDYSGLQGKWYNANDFIYPVQKKDELDITFNEGGKSAHIHLIIHKSNNERVIIDRKVSFDYLGYGVFTEQPDDFIKLYKTRNWILINIDLPNEPNTTVEFVRKSDMEKIIKCMDLTAQDIGIKDWRNPETIGIEEEEGTPYIIYEGKDEEGKYIIAVRNSKDTTIGAWYYFNPDTLAYEVDPQF